MEYEQKVIIHFFFKEGMSFADIRSRFTASFTNATGSLRSIHRWYTAMS
jgi:hypothetical protein